MTVKKAFAIFLLLAMMLCASAAFAKEVEYTFNKLEYDKGITTISWTKSREDDGAKYLLIMIDGGNDVK